MIYVLIFFISLILTIFSLPYVIDFLRKLDIVDMPGERKIHTEPVPRMGGIVIYVVTFLTLFSFIPDLNMIRMIFVASSLLLICGMIDDKRGLNWKKKFIMQFAASIAIVIFFAPMIDKLSIFTVIIPSPWSYALLSVFIVGVINSINMMDGMDGLVTGFSLLVFFTIFWLAYLTDNFFLLVMCSALVGSTLGFLKYNAYPARIFLGDTGSLVLGLFIAIASLFITPDYNGGKQISLTFPIIVMGLPILDTLKVMTIRLMNKKNPFLPDRNHFHHILIDGNFRHKYIVFFIEVISILFILIAYYYMAVSKGMAVILFVVLGSSVLFMKLYMLRLLRFLGIRTNFEKLMNRVPIEYLSIYKKFLVPLSVFASAIIIAFLIPGRSAMGPLTKIIIVAACAILFFLSHYHFIRNGVFSETYVLINLLIFTAVASVSSPLAKLISIPQDSWQIVVTFSYLFLFLFIVFFLLTRDRLFDKPPAFLSGIDLIILVLIFLITVVQNFIHTIGLEFIGVHLLIGFGIYLWYKIIGHWRTDFAVFLFYFSFVLPIASMLLLIII